VAGAHEFMHTGQIERMKAAASFPQ